VPGAGSASIPSWVLAVVLPLMAILMATFLWGISRKPNGAKGRLAIGLKTAANSKGLELVFECEVVSEYPRQDQPSLPGSPERGSPDVASEGGDEDT
jgi:hypothetical protein